MRFVELAFTVPAPSAELWADALVEAGAPGVEERDATTLMDAPRGRTTLVVWISPDDAESYVARAMEASQRLPEPVLQRRDRDEDEWRDAWKKHFGILRVPPFVIVPSWETLPAQDSSIAIDLDPGRAFGTGGHASTRLCLRLLGDLRERKVERFLDVGCGSGVLAIACAKLWPEARGLGIDVDADAVEVARENAERNRVADRIAFSTDDLARVEGRFDVVTANIQPEVLMPMAERLASLVAGRLILSGILVEAAPPVADAYRARGFVLDGERDEDGWRALGLRNLHR